MLAALVISRGELVSADALAEIAWGDAQPADPKSAIYNLISRLRSLLATADDIEVLTRPPGYVLQAPRTAVDACLAEDLVRAARLSVEPAEGVALLDAALCLWRGQAYAEFADEDFARAESARLHDLRQFAREELVGLMLTMGANSDAIGHLKVIIADEPLRERPRQQLMIALYRCGQSADALATYREYRATLDEELGVEPSEAMTDLERRILLRDISGTLSNEQSEPLDLPEARLAGGSTHYTFRAPPLVDLVGRTADLASTDDLLLGRRVLTLVGVGGVGKTVLAQHLIQRVAARYPDGVITCELGAISDPGQVVEIIAAAVGVIPQPGQDLAELVATALGNRRSLLFIDNCEHVLGAAAGFVHRMMAGRTATAVLATSRERLGVAEEQVWKVDPLPVPLNDDLECVSVELFVARARALDRTFQATPALAELCRRLDGLPLAIELSAARITSLTVEEILERLDEQSHLLRSNRPTTTTRHRSLHDVVDWSYRLLSPDQRTIFDQLTVFPADFSLDAATDIVDINLPKAEIAAAVLDLVDRSLVQHTALEGRSRYMLLETLRRYGHSHLAEHGQLNDLQERHAASYLKLAQEIGQSFGAGQSDWIRRLDKEVPNLRAAHRWLYGRRDAKRLLLLTESLHYYAICSLNTEAFDWATDTISLPDADKDPLVAAAYATAADGAWLAGDVQASRTLAELGMSVAELGDHPARRYAFISLANALATFAGRFDTRAELYRRAAAVASEAQMEPQRILAEIALGGCLARLGNKAEAIRIVDVAVRDARRIGSPDLEARAELLRADLLLGKDQVRVMSAYRRAADLSMKSGNRYQEYQAVISAAFAEIIYGDDRAAAATFRSVLTQWTGLLRNGPLFCVLQGAVILLAGAGHHREASTLSGAVPNETVTIAFTIDEQVVQRLAAATRAAREHLGPAAFEQEKRHGRQLDRGALVEYAIAALQLLDDTSGSSDPLAAPR